MSVALQKQLELMEKWEQYKIQKQNGEEPNPSIYELLAEATPDKKQRKNLLNSGSSEYHILDKYRKLVSVDFAKTNDLTDHKLDAIKKLYEQKRQIKEIAEIVGMDAFTVAYLITEKFSQKGG